MLIKINIYLQPSSLGLRGLLITKEVQVAAIFALGALSEEEKNMGIRSRKT